MTAVVVSLVAGLSVMDAIDDMAFGNRWAGCPTELYGALGLILGGVYAPEVLAKMRHERGKGKAKGGETSD